MTNRPAKDSIWLGFSVGFGLNGLAATLGMAASLVLLLGMGMSSNPEANRSVMNSLLFGWACCPLALNLPGLGYPLLTRRWGFLRGWLYGLAITFAYVLFCAALLGAYVFLLARTEGV